MMPEPADILARLKAWPGAKGWRIPGKTYQILMAPYRTKLRFLTGEWAMAECNSFRVLGSIRAFGDHPKEHPAVTVGQHVEIALGAVLLAGGEHAHDRAVNLSLGTLLLEHYTERQGMLAEQPTRIGNAVTISANTLILAGVTVGDGAVIGAGAVVTKDVPPFAIVAGNPARILRYRFDEATIADLLEIRWWDLRLPFLREHIRELRDLHLPQLREKYLGLGAEAYQPKTDNCMVFQSLSEKDTGNVAFIGAEVNGRFIGKDDLPPEFHFYFGQAKNGPQDVTYCIDDIFAFSGLTVQNA